MKEKTVFPAHPMRGDVTGNLARVRAIVRTLFLTPGIVPVVPYLSAFDVLDDNIVYERVLGMGATETYFRRGMIDEVWLYGDRISDGMRAEIRLAKEFGIPVIAKTAMTLRDLEEMGMVRLVQR